MTESKYIVVSNDYDEKMIIFDPSINHDTMAKALKRARYHKVISAGFIDEFMQCHGESMTLFKRSRKEDTNLLQSMMGIDDKKLVFKDDS